jgi:c-di-GMP-binding flagellar brake protein YcgR
LLSDDKILYLSVFTVKGKLLLKVDSNFSIIRQPEHGDLLIIKGKNLPILSRGVKIKLVVDFKGGERVNFDCNIVMSISQQLNISFSQTAGTSLEERRRYYKIDCEVKCAVRAAERDGIVVELSPPAFGIIKDINLGGVFLRIDPQKVVLKVNDVITLYIPNIMGSKLQLSARILRVQAPQSSEDMQGYGCCFTSVTPNDEQLLSKYIYSLQIEKRKQEAALKS